MEVFKYGSVMALLGHRTYLCGSPLSAIEIPLTDVASYEVTDLDLLRIVQFSTALLQCRSV